jgi:predicted permease
MLRPRVARAFRLAIRRRDRTARDVDAELRFHLELRVEQLVAGGWAREEAEAEARRRFGPSWDEAVRQLRRSGQAREERMAMRERLDSLWHDVRYAARALWRAPRFAATAVLTLSIGLGATTAIFSHVDHVVLRPLPYHDPDRLVVVREVLGELRDVYPTMPANGSHFLEWRRACGACEGIAAVKRSAATLTGAGDAQRLGAARVSANLFPLLGVRPALGRGFRPEEEQAGRDRVVVLGDAFWRRQFGGDPGVVGRAITLNGTDHEVVGVMPPGFALAGGNALGEGVNLPRDLDFYRPLAFSEHEATATGEYDYAVIARLRSGVTVAQAQARFAAIAAELQGRDAERSELGAAVVPLQAQVVGAAGRPMLLLLAAVGAVLLIVCVNLAGLSLARNAGRQRESAVRVALGAGRGRLTRLALAESVVLALAGGAVGLLLAHWGLRVLVALAPATLPRTGEVGLDARVFATAALLALAVGVAVGIVPALRMSRADPGEALKAGGRTTKGGRAVARRRALFIGAQVALSTVLLVAAGLFLASFVRVLRVDRGFDSERVLAFDVALPATAYESEARRAGFFDRALAELAAVPGASATAVASALPLEGETWVDGVERAGDARPVRERVTANFRFVTPGYFSVVGTAVRRGRAFTDADRTRRVVVISERTARALWPDGDAIGQRLLARSGHPPAEVVGVAADVRTSSLEQEGSLVIYLPFWESSLWAGTVLVRTAGEPAAVSPAARAALRRLDPAVPVAKVRTMAQVVSAAVAGRRFQLALLALFALMALVTASVGIYGVVSQSLASRTGEIGVRMALGARPADVHRLVLREGLVPAAAGLGLGVVGAVALARGFATLLFEVRAADPLTIAAVAALLGLVALVACLIPARRAAAAGVAEMLRLE